MNDDQLSAALKGLIGKPASELLLHREPMLLIDRLVDIGADFVSCEWRAGSSAFAEPDGRIPAYTGIETMAQCIGVHAGARARVRGLGPPLGYLLGTRHFSTSIAYFEPGVSYTATCTELVRDSQGMGSFACEIAAGGERLATANLAVLEHPQG